MLDEYSGLNINKCPFCKLDSNTTGIVTDSDNGMDNLRVECGGCTALGPESDPIEMALGVDSEDHQNARKQAIKRWNAATS